MKRFRHYKKDKAILISAFGSIVSMEAYNDFMDYIASEYNDFDVYMSFSSPMVLKILSSRGIEYKNQIESLSFLDREGYKKQIVLSLNLFPTDEHSFCLRVVKGFQSFSPALIRLTRAILTKTEDANILLNDISRIVRKEDPSSICLYIIHGTPYFDQAGLQSITYVRDFLSFLDPLNFVCALEGSYAFKYLGESLRSSFKSLGINELVVVPLLLVSGNHFIKDIKSISEFFSSDFSVRVKDSVSDVSRGFYLLELSSVRSLLKKAIDDEITKLDIG